MFITLYFHLLNHWNWNEQNLINQYTGLGFRVYFRDTVFLNENIDLDNDVQILLQDWFADLDKFNLPSFPSQNAIVFHKMR